MRTYESLFLSNDERKSVFKNVVSYFLSGRKRFNFVLLFAFPLYCTQEFHLLWPTPFFADLCTTFPVVQPVDRLQLCVCTCTPTVDFDAVKKNQCDREGLAPDDTARVSSSTIKNATGNEKLLWSRRRRRVLESVLPPPPTFCCVVFICPISCVQQQIATQNGRCCGQ